MIEVQSGPMPGPGATHSRSLVFTICDAADTSGEINGFMKVQAANLDGGGFRRGGRHLYAVTDAIIDLPHKKTLTAFVRFLMLKLPGPAWVGVKARSSDTDMHWGLL